MQKPGLVLGGLGLFVTGIIVFAGIERYALTRSISPIEAVVNANSLPATEKRAYFEEFVDKNSGSREEKVQDAVTSARMRLAYLDANEKKPGEAREQFLEAEKEHSGSDAMDPAYGTMPDQARYQAINCLLLENRETEAKKEYIAFLKERPLSPLVFGVHKRLIKLLDENETRDEIDQLLQVAVTKQEEFNKRELALCGPRVIEKLIELESLPARSLDDIVSISGLTDEGTSMSGMQKALSDLEIESTGMLVNSQDFNKEKLPFIWLDKGHYLLVHTRKNDKFVVYDPFIRNDREVASPKNATEFSATILKLK